ncbi:MAG: OsmC family protein [Candidatus Bipolaricaulia bacterium]
MGALGACTVMTLRLYAEHKGIPLEGVHVALRFERIYAKDCEDCAKEVQEQPGKIQHIARDITVTGDLSDEQVDRMLYIAGHCLVHLTLTEGPHIADTDRPDARLSERRRCVNEEPKTVKGRVEVEIHNAQISDRPPHEYLNRTRSTDL